MLKNTKIVIVICVILVIALGAMMMVERQNPAAGSEWIRSLLTFL